MKRIFIILTAVSALSCFVSCSKKSVTPEPAPVTTHSFSIEAQLMELGQDADVKGSLDSFISASWTEGDQLSVVNLTTGKVLSGTLKADRDGTVSTFSGTVGGTITKGDQISLFYPAIENQSGNEIDFGSRTISVAAQDKSSGVTLVATGEFTAESATGKYSGLKIIFQYGISYLKMNLANLPCKQGGCVASKILLRNISTNVTYSIDDTKKEFIISTSEERKAKGVIEVIGPFNISENGVLMFPVAVVPADNSETRMVVVTIEGDGEYSAPITSAELSHNRYYNTIASKFEKTGIAGVDAYGAYLITGEVLSRNVQYESSIISGVEAGEMDFSIVHNPTGAFWSIKGLPESINEGDSFTARFLSNKVTGIPNNPIEGAKVQKITKDGDYSKVWVTAHNDDADYLFIIRK